MKRLALLLALTLLALAKDTGTLALLGDVQRIAGVAVGSDSFYTLTARAVQVWNTETGEQRTTMNGAANEDWTALALGKDERNLAVAVRDRNGPGKTNIRLYPMGPGNPRQFLVDDLIESLAFSPEGGLVACGPSGRGPVWVHEIGTGRLRVKLEAQPSLNSVLSVTFSPDGKKVAAGASLAAYVWDLGTGNLVQTFTGKNNVRGVAFSADGKQLFATLDGLTAYDLASGAVLWNQKGDPGPLALSPDGRTLVWAARDVRLVDPATGAPGKVLTAPVITKAVAVPSSVCAAFTADGKRFLTGGDGGARLWSTSGKWLGGMAAWPNQAWVAYAADGSYQSSDNADEFLRFESGGRLQLIKDFKKSLLRPEQVQRGWKP